MSDRRPALSSESDDEAPTPTPASDDEGISAAPAKGPANTAPTVATRVDAHAESGGSGDDSEAPTATRIGRYTVLDLLGQGGMGRVYAVYDDQLDRRVALKLLKGHHRGDGRKRMLREAQAMAKLSHPNVVPVFEVGEHEGQLFLVMEHVEGVTLRQWCDQASRSWREVLDKYLQAGRGLAAAHAEGLVHRDFKPQNAVVGHHDRVRVLDFGLATRRGERDSATPDPVTLSPQEDALDTPLTHPGDVMGTPAYMPPEQFRGAEVDHRGDQFSFCVALWEALYGARPFGPSGTDPKADARRQLQRRVVEGKISAPETTRVPPSLRPILERGLRPNPDDRWPDLPSLLAELERRNVDPGRSRRRLVLTLGAIAVAGAGMVGLDRWRDWEREHRLQACEDAASDELEPVWNDTARDAVATGLRSTGVSYAETSATNALTRLGLYADAWKTARVEACARTHVREEWGDGNLDRARWCLDQRAMELHSLLGQLANADQRVATEAVSAAAGLTRVQPCLDAALLERLPAPPLAHHRATVRSILEQLSMVAAMQATGRYDAAVSAARAAFAEAETLGDPGVRAAAGAALGSVLDDEGEYPEAETLLEESYFEATEVHDFETAFEAASALALVVGYRLERHDEGRRWNRLAQGALTELGIDDDAPELARNLNTEAMLLHGGGKYDEAVKPLRRALGIWESALGPNHPAVARALANLAMIVGATGDYAQAKTLYGRAVDVLTEALGPDHPGIARTLSNLAVVHRLSGDYVQALALNERALALRERAFGPDHPDVAVSLNNLANVHVDMGHHDLAKPLLERAVAITEANHGPQHPALARNLDNLGGIYSATGDYAHATALRTRALAIKEATLPPDHPSIAITLNNLASSQFALEAYPEAIALHERALAIRQRALAPDHPDVALSLTHLAEVHRAQGSHVRAEAMFERAVEIFDGREDASPTELKARFGYAQALIATGGDRSRAIAEAEKAAAGYRDAGPDAAAELAEVQAWLAKNRL